MKGMKIDMTETTPAASTANGEKKATMRLIRWWVSVDVLLEGLERAAEENDGKEWGWDAPFF
jgi:hypothetical protein